MLSRFLKTVFFIKIFTGRIKLTMLTLITECQYRANTVASRHSIGRINSRSVCMKGTVRKTLTAERGVAKLVTKTFHTSTVWTNTI